MKIIIHGRVQGIFFRAFVKETADKLGIKGYVKNMPDETVEIIAEGDERAINELIKDCKKGPSGSFVKEVKAEKVRNNGYSRFDIIY